MTHSRPRLKGTTPALGVLLPTREVVASRGDVGELLALARLAEELGFDSVWAGDSVVARPRLDPLSTLAVVAGATDRVTLGTSVLIPALRHPVLLAHTTASIQALSGGRLVLGVGAGPDYGPTRKEFAALGVPFERRFTRLLRTMEVCQQLWSGGTVSLTDQYFSIPKAAIAPTPVTIPVWLGSSSKRGLQEAGSRFDGWLPIPRSVEQFTSDKAVLRRSSASSAGAPVTGCYLTAGVSDGSGEFGQKARRALERYYASPWATIANLSDTFLGSAEEVASWVRSYVDAGADHVIMRLLGADPQRQLRAMAPYLSALRAST